MTPEERIKAAAEVMRRDGQHTNYEGLARLAAPILNPEDFPPKPKWPTDETMNRLFGRDGEWPAASREPTGHALRDTDPIIKAAVAHRDMMAALEDGHSRCIVCDAVNEAGL